VNSYAIYSAYHLLFLLSLNIGIQFTVRCLGLSDNSFKAVVLLLPVSASVLLTLFVAVLIIENLSQFLRSKLS